MPDYQLRDIPSPIACTLRCSCYEEARKATRGQRILRLRINPLPMGELFEISMCFDCFVRETKEMQPLNWTNGSCHLCHLHFGEHDQLYRIQYANKKGFWCHCTLCPGCRDLLLVPPPMTMEEAVRHINNPSEYLRAVAAKLLEAKH